MSDEARDEISWWVFDQIKWCNQDAIVDRLYEAEAERDRLWELVADYENGISWGVTCTGCADQLDVHYDGWVQGHKAGLREGWDEGLAAHDLPPDQWVNPHEVD